MNFNWIVDLNFMADEQPVANDDEADDINQDDTLPVYMDIKIGISVISTETIEN